MKWIFLNFYKNSNFKKNENNILNKTYTLTQRKLFILINFKRQIY